MASTLRLSLAEWLPLPTQSSSEKRARSSGATSLEADCVHFKVSDIGEGIPSENLESIFEPLFTTKKKGSGIGLTVVHQIVTAHGGHISVESEVGKGTTFDIGIPVQK